VRDSARESSSGTRSYDAGDDRHGGERVDVGVHTARSAAMLPPPRPDVYRFGVVEQSTVFIPGLLCTPRLYAEQLPAVWRLGPVTVARHHDDRIQAIADRILSAAPPRFALVGLSMGGYVAFEILRQAPDRVTRLALLDTTARPDTAEATRRRRDQIALALDGQFGDVVDVLFRAWVRPAGHDDAALRQVVRTMAEQTGPVVFARQQTAIMNRPDSRPGLAAIRCPTLVVVGGQDTLTTPEHAKEIADGIPGARLAVVPECGHLSTLEQPATVTGILVDWLSGA
jgi:pimeloyl-ACP methyl ester carboxylesterase